MRGSRVLAVAGLLAATMGAAIAAEPPSEIKIGTLYAGSGQLASASVPLHAALEMWADGINKDGGALRVRRRLCQRVRQENPGSPGVV